MDARRRTNKAARSDRGSRHTKGVAGPQMKGEGFPAILPFIYFTFDEKQSRVLKQQQQQQQQQRKKNAFLDNRTSSHRLTAPSEKTSPPHFTPPAARHDAPTRADWRDGLAFLPR